MHRTVTTAALAAATAVVTLGLSPAAASAAQAAGPVVPFSADSGDRCRHGVTEGTLEWVTGPVVRPTVRVEGYVADSADTSLCPADGLYSTAAITAYDEKGIVDRDVRKADDGKREFAFELSDSTGVRRLERVVVRVCRHASTGIGYCGTAQEYKSPLLP